LLVDVDKCSTRSRLADRFRRRDEGVRDGDDNVTRPHTGCHQRKKNGVRATRDADAMLRIAKTREVFLEFVNHWTADETRCSERLLKNGDQFALEFGMKTDQIQKRYVLIV
jgi:hypothetical protein